MELIHPDRQIGIKSGGEKKVKKINNKKKEKFTNVNIFGGWGIKGRKKMWERVGIERQPT